jgi:hypothetical protein
MDKSSKLNNYSQSALTDSLLEPQIADKKIRQHNQLAFAPPDSFTISACIDADLTD